MKIFVKFINKLIRKDTTKEVNHKKLVYRLFVVYCVTFQKYDMSVLRDFEEINNIIEDILCYRNTIKNETSFEDDFKYLCSKESINTLKSSLESVKKKATLRKLSLTQFSDFIQE